MKYSAFIFILLFAGGVQACSFGPDADIRKTAAENYPHYQYVISGTFIEKKEASGYSATYFFEIYSVHKGEIESATLELHSPGHSCGFFGATGGHVLLFMNTLDTIDESVPKYYFDTRIEATQGGQKLSIGIENPTQEPTPNDSEEIVEVDVSALPQAEGPTQPPIDGFVGPQSPPPYDNSVKIHEPAPHKSWWRRMWDWITGLFS